jgi:hypothetical protein
MAAPGIEKIDGKRIARSGSANYAIDIDFGIRSPRGLSGEIERTLHRP